jgi:hypothetical protein
MLIMPISLYRRRIAATVIQLAKDDPSLVKEVIARLRESGEIEPTIWSTWTGSPTAGSGLPRTTGKARRINAPASSARVVDAFGLRHSAAIFVQQIGTFIVQRIGPSGQCLFDVVLCSRPVEVETEFSEVLDFVGREP